MNGNIPKISVIMSTFNREKFLSRSIESVLSQTYKDFDLVLINNGSTDGSAELCEKYAQKYKQIKLIHIEQNRGAPTGRNKGIESASGEYITFVDDDDYCEPQLLEFLYELIINNNADIAVCGSWNDFNGTLEPYFIYDAVYNLNKAEALEELLKREIYNVAPPTKLFHKSLFDHIHFKENVLVDDIHIIYKVFAKADRVVAHGKPLYKFTKHEGNMTNFIQTNNLTPNLINEYLTAFRERTKYISLHVPEVSQRVIYSEWSYMISMCYKIKEYEIMECFDIYNEMIKTLKSKLMEVMNNPYIKVSEIEVLKELIKEE